ncbi:MAG: SPOR domain-containing protein [Ferrovibrio sp.]|uniref:SPOR domain-containing protein n=1 Tax=Ferrovibrio sp. TaxID=1917215 RepID=UPI0026165276|nr:SPOR domain-containing protein [Ferrovibrio sp.]MCW0236420.1 SPOR domain-containing protein [Ferrovibrio sp.]
MSDLRGDRNMRPVPGESANPGMRSPKRLITAGIALGAVAAFGIGIWFAYDQGVKRGASGAPPLIRADQGPAKVAPENPGGMQVPNQDKQIYERLPGNSPAGNTAGTEKLLPPPERPTATPTQPGVATSPAVNVPTRPVQTVPNQSPNRTDAPSPAPIPPAPAAPGQPQPVAPRTATTPATPAPAAQTPAPAPAARSVTATPGGSAKIQLASLKDQAAATATWNQLQKKFPDVLGGLQPSYEKVEIANKGTFIRLQAGPLKDRAEATAICSTLAAKNQGCIVVGR